MTATRTPKEDLLVGGLDDWADAGWAAMSARLAGEMDPVGFRDATLELIGEVLREGLMVPGDVVDSVHVPWQGEPKDWIDRIRYEWIGEWGTEIPTPGAIVWLENTEAGARVARDVLKREASRQ